MKEKPRHPYKGIRGTDPSARCAYAANAVGKDLDIFVIGAVSLNYIYTQQPTIVNNICSYS
jgi:hypothetical protein